MEQRDIVERYSLEEFFKNSKEYVCGSKDKKIIPYIIMYQESDYLVGLQAVEIDGKHILLKSVKAPNINYLLDKLHLEENVNLQNLDTLLKHSDKYKFTFVRFSCKSRCYQFSLENDEKKLKSFYASETIPLKEVLTDCDQSFGSFINIPDEERIF